MPPLILHNVPDDELYIGEDGVQRPYAIVFPGNDGINSGTRSRRVAPETGSFGKSTRRSKSRTGTPAVKRENPTLAAADTIFTQYLAQRAAENPDTHHRATGLSSVSQSNALVGPSERNSVSKSTPRFSKHRHDEPTEVILRGFKSSQQYAAIREYERIAGRICEDYPRDPPVEQRKFKTDFRDPISLRPKALTAEEKAKALKFHGGDNWIKVTFSSTETAEAAIQSSPQKILGHLVYAELYRGVPPSIDGEILATDNTGQFSQNNFADVPALDIPSNPNVPQVEENYIISGSFIYPEMKNKDHDINFISSSGSQRSTATFISGTINSTDTATGSGSVLAQQSVGEFCQRIPTARRMRLLPADEALLPQQSPFRKFLSSLPFISWVSKDIIGGALPRTDSGEFDHKNASLYWKLMWYIERFTGIIIIGDPKDD